MGRQLVIAGNWKMYKTTEETQSFVQQLLPSLNVNDREILLAVPFTLIQTAASMAGDNPAVKVGAQNMNDCSEGAFTGEIAGHMLLDIGAQFVLLGHSERRQLFGEDNAFINRKVKRAFIDGILPVVCVGETLQEREGGQTEAVLREQLSESLADIPAENMPSIILAYEPVWAIGTGKTATPEQAQEVHQMLRAAVSETWGADVAASLRILYGGSVKPANAGELLSQTDIDGVLVGGASLDADSFAQIANAEVAVAPAPVETVETIHEDRSDLSNEVAAEDEEVEEEEPPHYDEGTFELDEDQLDAADRVEDVPEDEMNTASMEEEDRLAFEDEEPEDIEADLVEENEKPSTES